MRKEGKAPNRTGQEVTKDRFSSTEWLGQAWEIHIQKKREKEASLGGLGISFSECVHLQGGARPRWLLSSSEMPPDSQQEQKSTDWISGSKWIQSSRRFKLLQTSDLSQVLLLDVSLYLFHLHRFYFIFIPFQQRHILVNVPALAKKLLFPL